MKPMVVARVRCWPLTSIGSMKGFGDTDRIWEHWRWEEVARVVLITEAQQNSSD